MNDYIYSIYSGNAPDGWYGAPFEILQWTTELPTKEGLYWFAWKHNNEWKEPTEIRFVLHDNKIKREISNYGDTDFEVFPSPLFVGEDWRLLGPLLVPEPPKD